MGKDKKDKKDKKGKKDEKKLLKSKKNKKDKGCKKSKSEKKNGKKGKKNKKSAKNKSVLKKEQCDSLVVEDVTIISVSEPSSASTPSPEPPSEPNNNYDPATVSDFAAKFIDKSKPPVTDNAENTADNAQKSESPRTCLFVRLAGVNGHGMKPFVSTDITNGSNDSDDERITDVTTDGDAMSAPTDTNTDITVTDDAAEYEFTSQSDSDADTGNDDLFVVASPGSVFITSGLDSKKSAAASESTDTVVSDFMSEEEYIRCSQSVMEDAIGDMRGILANAQKRINDTLEQLSDIPPED